VFNRMTQRYILMKFLAEALTITFIGGVLGVVLAYAAAPPAWSER